MALNSGVAPILLAQINTFSPLWSTVVVNVGNPYAVKLKTGFSGFNEGQPCVV